MKATELVETTEIFKHITDTPSGLYVFEENLMQSFQIEEKEALQVLESAQEKGLLEKVYRIVCRFCGYQDSERYLSIEDMKEAEECEHCYKPFQADNPFFTLYFRKR